MTEFTVRSDSVDVEQIMEQIRARVREKRGTDYTEEEVRQLAGVKLERFLDPGKVRSELLEEFRRVRQGTVAEGYRFNEETLYASHRLPLLRKARRLLNPVLRLFFNPNPIVRGLSVLSGMAAREPLTYEVLSNLVLEVTRLSIEVKNLRMRVESLSTRLEFDERRAHALEGVVQYRPDALRAEETDSTAAPESAGPGAEGRARRRRRRRGRRPPPMAGPGQTSSATPGQETVPEQSPGETGSSEDGRSGRSPDDQTGA